MAYANMRFYMPFKNIHFMNNVFEPEIVIEIVL